MSLGHPAVLCESTAYRTRTFEASVDVSGVEEVVKHDLFLAPPLFVMSWYIEDNVSIVSYQSDSNSPYSYLYYKVFREAVLLLKRTQLTLLSKMAFRVKRRDKPLPSAVQKVTQDLGTLILSI